ncbi:hypothetical protein [Elstera cyanobacteriorum]|uniref:hypothetical protein n=2 Tax=Elstera cyanobacteriorum TaxID=2022747 RepID=UPI0023F09A61|nr:hypothetical protein [Elstera cyanobacteriorum]
MQNEIGFMLGKSPFANNLEERILHRHKSKGWAALAGRVVNLASQAENGRSEDDTEQYLEEFHAALMSCSLLPNSPLLVNAGEEKQRVFACFAVDVRRPIDEILPIFRFIHDGMGGVGYTVSGGEGSLTSLVQTIDQDTVAHQSGRPRPASNAVTMPIDGDLGAFLSMAGKLSVTNMNVAIDDGFMEALDSDAIAMRRLRSVATSIHQSGQPGVLFPGRLSRIAREEAPPFAANVCGEAPLAVDESAPLASLNLVRFCKLNGSGFTAFDERAFVRHAQLATRFLDGIHDYQCHGTGTMRLNTMATRKIGVGVMGFAHALILCGIRYGSPESTVFAERIAGLLMSAVRTESERLARKFGPYPSWRPEHGAPRRNAGLVAIAGTATLALIAGTTGGIEPMFSPVLSQTVIGKTMRLVDPIVMYMLTNHGIDQGRAEARLLAGESLREVAGDKLADLMPSASDVPGDQHIVVQAAFQRHIDCGITKTINCPSTTTEEQILGWIRMAHSLGCLGMTIYRDGSLDDQPMRRA